MKPFNFYRYETLKCTYLPAAPGYLPSCYLLPAESGAQKASGNVHWNLSAPSVVHAMTPLSFSHLLWSGTRVGVLGSRDSSQVLVSTVCNPSIS